MLVTLAEMKSYLGVQTSDTSHDTFLTEQINLISDVIEAYTRRVFSSASYAQTFYRTDFDQTHELSLFHFPLVSVTSIVEDGTTLDSSLYRINKPTGIITRPDSYFFSCPVETVVTYTAGYAAIPSPIKSVVYTLVQERYNKKNSGVDLNFGSDVQRISIPGAISIDFDYSLSNNDRKTPFGTILGSQINVLDYYRSERSITGSGKLTYL